MIVAAQSTTGAAANDWTTVVVVVVVVAAFAAAAISGIRASRRPPFSTTVVRATGPASLELLDESDPWGRRVRLFELALLFTLGGYLLFDRAFAWIHIPGTPAFIGELVIAYGVVVLLGIHTNLSVAIKNSSSLKALLVYMLWGAALLALAVPTYGLDAIRDAALWYYGIIAIFIVVLVLIQPARINRWLVLYGRAIPYFLLWFPVATVAIAVGGDGVPRVPDSTVPITSHRVGNMAVAAAAALGFLWMVDSESKLYTQRQRVWLTSLATAVIILAGMKNRGGFLAAGFALVLAMLLMRHRRSELSLVMVGAVVFLLAVGLLGDVKIGLFDDDREVSVEQMLLNITSIIDQDAGGSRQTGTISWRLEIWGKVVDDVTTDSPLTGFGPGPDLGERYNISTDPEQPLRNPHNSHVGILARSGMVGATLWGMLWLLWTAELLLVRSRLLARGRRVEGAVLAWLIVSSAAILINSIFDPALEGPQVAWWLWAMLGLGIAMVALERIGRLPDLNLAATSPSPAPTQRPHPSGVRRG
jgi:hypothetical protein